MIKFSYKFKIPIEITSNKIQEELRNFNIKNKTKIKDKIIKILYKNKLYELNQKHFKYNNEKISFSEVNNLLKTKEALLYIGERTFFSRQRCYAMNKFYYVIGEDIYIKNYKKSDIEKFITHLTEKFSGELVIYKNDKEIHQVTVHIGGMEIHNIEDKEKICLKIYEEYGFNLVKLDNKEIWVRNNITKKASKLESDNPIVSNILNYAYQRGYLTKVYEGYKKVSFEIEGILSEVLLQKNLVYEIESCLENSKVYKELSFKLKQQNDQYIIEFHTNLNNLLNNNQKLNEEYILNHYTDKNVIASITQNGECIKMDFYETS